MSNYQPHRQSHSRLPINPDDLPSEDTPLAKITGEFFFNNWVEARDGLLSKTNIIEVDPEPCPSPSAFHFRIHAAYKRKLPDGTVELTPGPLEGMIFYRPDLFAPADGNVPSIIVLIDDSRFYHPNFSRTNLVLCLGELPPGPFPLERLLEHLYSILSYQNIQVTDPFDLEAANYFATDCTALDGLTDSKPLY